jgi:hypothetical protein
MLLMGSSRLDVADETSVIKLPSGGVANYKVRCRGGVIEDDGDGGEKKRKRICMCVCCEFACPCEEPIQRVHQLISKF